MMSTNPEAPTPPRDVVAIDGPSGAGKSTVARALAARLGFAYLDTGAMYRAVTWGLLERQFTDLENERELGAILDELALGIDADGAVSLNGRDVTTHLRSREVESRVSAVSAVPIVRQRMRAMQREIAATSPVVAEGRDMATIVFPTARWKVYLDAEPEERARRRLDDFLGRGRDVTFEVVLEEIAVRDRLDSTRKDAPLMRSRDASYVDTTGMSLDDVVDAITRIVEPAATNHGTSGGAAP